MRKNLVDILQIIKYSKGPFLYDVNKKIQFFDIPGASVNIQLDTIKVDGFLSIQYAIVIGSDAFNMHLAAKMQQLASKVMIYGAC